MEENLYLQNEARDVLREIGNIGMGSSVAAISNILHEEFRISIEKISALNENTNVEHIEDAACQVCGVLFHFSGEIEGVLLFILEEKFLQQLSGAIVQNSIADERNIDIEKDHICEVINLMASSYLSSVVAYANLKIQISYPAISFDMIGALLSDAVAPFISLGKKNIWMEGHFYQESQDARNSIILLLDGISVDTYLGALGVAASENE